MKGLIFLIFLIPFSVSSQESVFKSTSTDQLGYYIFNYSQVDGGGKSPDEILAFLKKFERKQEENSIEFLKVLFTKTRKTFLRHYEEYASFSETIGKGKYNCLTGTAMYALLLDHLGINYKVIETNYHIFLVASTKEGKVLFEATDPLNGFVDKPEDIENRIKQYKQNRIQETAANKKYYRYNFNLYNEVSLDQMEGLLHYNRSIVAYNQQNFPAAIEHLDKALVLYNSPRIAEFSTILLLSVMESKLDNAAKDRCVKSIQMIRRKQVPVIASRNYPH